MTPAEALRKEQEEIIQRTGDYIPPYRLSGIMRMAQKITELLTKSGDFFSYHESMMVLRIVMGAIREATGQQEEY